VAGTILVSPATPALAIGTRISTNDGDSDQFAAMAKNPVNGWLTAIWQADDGTQEFRIRTSTSVDGGVTWSNEITIFAGPGGQDMWGVRVAYDSNGGLHAIFAHGGGDGRRVKHRFVNPGSDPRQLANWRNGGDICASEACVFPDVAVDRNGFVYVAYEDTDNYVGVRRRLGASGTWSDEQRVLGGGKRIQGSIAVTTDGKIHVAYFNKDDRTASYARYTSFTAFNEEIDVTISTGDVPEAPDLVAGADNTVHIAWPQDDQVFYRSVAGGSPSGLRSVSNNFSGRANVSVAVSASNRVYVTWNDDNFREIWESTSADWDSPVRLAGSDPSARYQRYGVSLDGSVDMALVENNITKYLQREAAAPPDAGLPTITNITFPAATPDGSQRVLATVSGTDTGTGSGAPSGITTIQYSLDGVNYVTAAVLSPPQVTITNAQFVVDLANPGAGGAWGRANHTLRVRLIDARGNVGDATGPALAYAVPGVAVTRYLAEGYTGGTFDMYLTIGNPTAVTIFVSATFQYAGTSQGTPGTLVAVGPNRRATVLIDAIAGAGKELSLKLESNSPFYAERPMYFTNYPAAAGRAYNRVGASALSGITGGHVGVPAAAPAQDWYFAEGFTGPGFEGYFTIQNPNPVAVTVFITYFLANGTTQERSVSVAANQRRTVVIHGDAGQGGIGEGQTFSALVSSRTPVATIIVERVQYFRYNGTITGGTATLGATGTATTWHFAEGYTGTGFDEYLTIQNPGGAPGQATITYFVEGQAVPTQKVIQLPANSRTTVVVHNQNDPGGLGRGFQHSTRVVTTVPTVVERPMYFVYNGSGSATNVDGGHNVLGATSLINGGASVTMAEGYTGDGFNQYLTFQNPNAAPVPVTITYLKADGSAPVVKNLNLPANQRTTVVVHEPAGAGLGPGFEVSTRVTNNGAAGLGILVERVMYFKYLGVATGGSAALGTP
jgi:hypothetical protein